MSELLQKTSVSEGRSQRLSGLQHYLDLEMEAAVVYMLLVDEEE